MSLRLIKASMAIEHDDQFHMARILVLLKAGGKRSTKPIHGIMKLAKLDFLLRYPVALRRVLVAQNKKDDAAQLTEAECNTIEGKMIRFKYGPWDMRYRNWLSLLMSKGLIKVWREKNTISIELTELGVAASERIVMKKEFESILQRALLVHKAVGDYSPTKLKDYVYSVVPEITEMSWGKEIAL